MFFDDWKGLVRVTEEELRQAARGEGHADLLSVAAIVLETDGSFSILDSPPPGDPVAR